MMRKVSSVILDVIAGFFFYTVSLLAFVSEFPAGAKLGLLIGFSVPAVVALSGGLALTGFRNWRRNAGIVLLCSSGFTAFVAFTFACFLMTEEFSTMIEPNSLMFFSDYLTGAGVIIGLAILGGLLVKTNKDAAERDEDSLELQPPH